MNINQDKNEEIAPLQEIKIERPKRAKISEEEAIKWTEEFASKRKERFIASIRKSKS